ncbi:hypothetical protein [Chromobacterium sp. IIBBL 290-4]|uniref:hypothetical protein n=1 Tax=Chromobacterium sp. IIBBL 290-4 TaxID=2953890 RepID=UPI0020B85ADF|nr:hypothetical protein [Chromobacterium sp. IIBBL 290-4]UTH72240.1 hypothetical protein NKT35_11800 [Chromobacterium sp. IIBBL 290-4]
MKKTAGAEELTKYRETEGGLYLLRAYAARRETDKSESAARLQAVIAEITPEPGGSIAIDVFERLHAEMVRLMILDELDPLIKDLIKVISNQGLSGSDLFTELRAALRFGKGHTPSDAQTREKVRKIQAAWVQSYIKMEETGIYETEHAIAKRIAPENGFSVASAKNYLNKLMEDPIQERWIEQIIERALIVKAVRGISKKAARPSRVTGKTKPPSWK